MLTDVGDHINTLHKKVKDINTLNFLLPFIYATRARIACINYTKKLRIFISFTLLCRVSDHPTLHRR